MTPAILVVESDAQHRALLEDYLGRSYDVTAVQSGGEALEHLFDKDFSLAIVARDLPDTDGLALVDSLHDLLPSLPTVLCMVGLLESGAHGHLICQHCTPLCRPYVVSDLFQTVQAAIGAPYPASCALKTTHF